MNLQEHMQANIGLSIPNPVIDGRWHSGKGKLSKVSYVGHHLPNGTLVRYRNYSQSEDCYTWKEWEGQQDRLSDSEYQQRKIKANEKAKAAQAQASREKAEILAVIYQVIRESMPASVEHWYIAQKRIIPIRAKQVTKPYLIKTGQYINPDDLLIPIYNSNGQLIGLQQITHHKKLIRGSYSGGSLWIGGGLTTGEVANRLYIAEGYATAVSVHMRTRNPVLVAFGTSNLLSVGRWVRATYPDVELIYAVDNDVGTFIHVQSQRIENAGMYYATIAAKTVDAGLITPPMEGKADWNDWHISQIKNPLNDEISGLRNNF